MTTQPSHGAGPYRIEAGEHGPRLVLTSGWTDAVARVMAEEKIRELYLNYALGWSGTEIDFLELVPDIELFWIIDRQIGDVSPVNVLRRARSLRLDVSCRSTIRLDAFRDLVECWTDWHPGVRSLFDSLRLADLRLGNYVEQESAALGRLTQLRQLALYRSSLREIRALGALRELGAVLLADCRALGSLDGIESVAALEELQIHACPGIDDLTPLAGLRNLRTLVLVDLPNLRSLAPLTALPNLETLVLERSTNVRDGDLGPINALPNLRALSFTPRRHYTPRRTAFDPALFQRRYATRL